MKQNGKIEWIKINDCFYLFIVINAEDTIYQENLEFFIHKKYTLYLENIIDERSADYSFDVYRLESTKIIDNLIINGIEDFILFGKDD